MSQGSIEPPKRQKLPVRFWCAAGLALALCLAGEIASLPWTEVQRQGVDIPSFPCGGMLLEAAGFLVAIVALVWLLTWWVGRRS